MVILLCHDGDLDYADYLIQDENDEEILPSPDYIRRIP